jgi:hypothetical protein
MTHDTVILHILFRANFYNLPIQIPLELQPPNPAACPLISVSFRWDLRTAERIAAYFLTEFLPYYL